MREQPRQDRWLGWQGPSVPQTIQTPDRYEWDQTVLYGPKGEPLIIKRPRPFGFRPDRAR